MDKSVTHGSFCTGYGGLDMAVEKFFDAETVWYSEIDLACNKLLGKYGYETNLGDLTKIDWNEVEPVDIMSAGFPCQPFSFAGERKGEEDERAIFQWIADGISVLRPRVVVLENVAGILNLGGPSVLGAITGLGYDARWGIVRASDVGAPHQRQRWFCVASDSTSVRECPGQAEKIRGENTEGEKRVPIRSERSDSLHSDFEWGRYESAIKRWESVLGRPAPEPCTDINDRLINSSFLEWMMGLPENHVCNQGLSTSQELHALGNGVVPQQAYHALELLV